MNEQKKKILFVISSFKAGGAEKAMVSQLQCFDTNRYDIYAYIINDVGLFKPLFPSFVKSLPISDEIKAICSPINDISFFVKHPILFLKKIIRSFIAKKYPGGLAFAQKQWDLWKNDIPSIDGDYDIAVGHQQGLPNYMVVDKVHAKYKNLWIHTLYSKRKFNFNYDASYYAKSTSIITISDICKQDLEFCIPSQKDKYVVLPNIVNDRLIRQLSEEQVEEDFFLRGKKTIVTVGRLAYPKGIDRAVKTAKILSEKGIDFLWIVIGEGPMREELQQLIDSYQLQDNFKMVGLRNNPYKYIAKADIAVQPSEYEGKSIFADESKILNKVFVSTNYETIYDQITDGVNGIITEKDPLCLAEGIIRGLTDAKLRDRLMMHLSLEKLGNTEMINHYYEIYEGRVQNVFK